MIWTCSCTGVFRSGFITGAAQAGASCEQPKFATFASREVGQQFTDVPSMVLVFSAGAVYVEPIYRVLLVTLPLWLVSNVLLRGRFQVPVSWMLALLASASSPLTSSPPPRRSSGCPRPRSWQHTDSPSTWCNRLSKRKTGLSSRVLS
jgi:hypothetical protein